MYYDSELIYVNSKTGAAAKIAAIDAIIDVLFATILEAVATGATSEYMLNDGQTIIKKVYRSPDAVILTIETLRRLKTLYANDINNRSVRMVDSKNLLAKRYYR